MKLLWQSLLMAVLLTACSDFPADPNHSFEKAKALGLKVGLAINPPYVLQDDNGFSGIEVRLIEAFAQQHDLTPKYIIGTESELVRQLENYDLHLIAGGFDRTTIWTSKAGLSAPYDQTHVLLVPKGENQLLFRLEQHIFKVQ